jgi:Glu-tRNA(Gln) amidotransferase subunit E-like FAD-binding protein
MAVFKAGLEIHFQLDTKQKLFCSCSTAMKEREPIKVVTRKQHPVASELGEIDVAAQYEFLRDRVFHYQVFKNESCLVELDEEPPHPLNREALEIALQIALMFNCKIPSEIHVMRKTVIDGSNTAGFQRTTVVGLDGQMQYKGERIPITYVTLEEDAAAIVEEGDKEVTYRLNRLGIPLVEVDTGVLENFTPEEIQEIAYTIGIIAKSTRKIKRGIGAIRQDVNVSTGSGRVELKGVQYLDMLAKVIKIEIERQKSLGKVENETRAVQLDGTSKYMRPLPGAARMYPETDIPPIVISKAWLAELKKSLPETWDKKLERFKSKLKLSEQLAKEMLRSEYLDLFEEIVQKIKVEPTLVANTFVSTLKDLERKEKVQTERISDEHFFELFDLLSKGKIAKEAIPQILRFVANHPDRKITNAVKQLELELLPMSELEKIVKQTVQKDMAYDKAVGLVMSKVRGRADPQIVMKLVKKFLK